MTPAVGERWHPLQKCVLGGGKASWEQRVTARWHGIGFTTKQEQPCKHPNKKSKAGLMVVMSEFQLRVLVGSDNASDRSDKEL